MSGDRRDRGEGSDAALAGGDAPVVDVPTDPEGIDDDAAPEQLVSELDAAADAVDRARDAVAERGAEEVAAVADFHDEIAALLDRYEDRATDWDDFEGYAEFRREMGQLEVPAAAPDGVTEALEAADDSLVTGGVAETLSAGDFEDARAALAPLEECAAMRDARSAAESRYRAVRSAVAARADALEERIGELERLQSLGEADLDAPVARLREPIEAYDEAVTAAFADRRERVASRELLAAVDDAAARPLVGFEAPPERLTDYLDATPVGEEPVTTLLEYCGHSRSKLGHFVADPDAFRSAVATSQTYLERLDGGPMTVGWPPPPADRLRFCCRELTPVVASLADESAAERLRAVAARARDAEEYDRLRRAAVAREELSDAERERLASGAVDRELAAARDARELLADALDAHPRLERRADPT